MRIYTCIHREREREREREGSRRFYFIFLFVLLLGGGEEGEREGRVSHRIQVAKTSRKEPNGNSSYSGNSSYCTSIPRGKIRNKN